MEGAGSCGLFIGDIVESPAFLMSKRDKKQRRGLGRGGGKRRARIAADLGSSSLRPCFVCSTYFFVKTLQVETLKVVVLSIFVFGDHTQQMNLEIQPCVMYFATPARSQLNRENGLKNSKRIPSCVIFLIVFFFWSIPAPISIFRSP